MPVNKMVDLLNKILDYKENNEHFNKKEKAQLRGNFRQEIRNARPLILDPAPPAPDLY
jgi:ABC-type oligopeptide transport system ATPase subunit